MHALPELRDLIAGFSMFDAHDTDVSSIFDSITPRSTIGSALLLGRKKEKEAAHRTLSDTHLPLIVEN